MKVKIQNINRLRSLVYQTVTLMKKKKIIDTTELQFIQ